MRSALVVALLLAARPIAAEPLELETLDGAPQVVELRESDKALLVHFWATWCRECVDELPLLEKATARCPQHGVRIVTVNVGEDRETIVPFLERHGLALPVMRDPRGRTWRSLGGVGLPTNLTWTHSERRTAVGPRDRLEWEKKLRALGCPDPASQGPRGRVPDTAQERR